jgi:hypothetical protein
LILRSLANEVIVNSVDNVEQLRIIEDNFRMMKHQGVGWSKIYCSRPQQKHEHYQYDVATIENSFFKAILIQAIAMHTNYVDKSHWNHHHQFQGYLRPTKFFKWNQYISHLLWMDIFFPSLVWWETIAVITRYVVNYKILSSAHT